MEKEYDSLLHKASAYCAKAEHCIEEIAQKLNQWGANNEDKQAIIARLLAEKMIDEKRYCAHFVHDKYHFNKWGKIKIAFALREKKLNQNLIDDALAIIDETEYITSLIAILEKKLQSLRYKDSFEKHNKLFMFAQSRGFESSIITKVLRLLDKK